MRYSQLILFNALYLTVTYIRKKTVHYVITCYVHTCLLKRYEMFCEPKISLF